VKGLEDPSNFPDLFAALVASREWDYWDLEKIAGKNFIRVWEEVLKVKEELKDTEPVHSFQKRAEVRKHWDKGNCTSPSAFPDQSPTLPPFFTFQRNMFG